MTGIMQGVTATPGAAEDTEFEVGDHKRMGAAAWFAVAWLVIVLIMALFAQWIPGLADPYKIYEAPVIARSAPFSDAAHLLGGDASSRDVLARLAFGAKASVEISVGAVLIGLVVGGVLGLIAGFFRGKIDTVLSAITDIFLAFPALVLALSLVTFLGPQQNVAGRLDYKHIGPFNFTSKWVLIVALGLVSIPILARITRTSTLTWSQREFVMAARAQGAGNFRIIFREVLPNVLPAMLSIALLAVGVAMIAEAGLAILGLGTPPPTPSWGNMIALGQPNLSDAPQLVFIPSMAIFLTVLSLNYLGDVLRNRFDVRESAL